MTYRISPEQWAPRGVRDLEPVADEVVRSAQNMLVIAGPGAGKTELLAQRASFLLETGRCRAPQRILAISFKRDSASNLRDRVARRSGVELARQFDSLTFDAWAKSLVDRFFLGLPPAFQPTRDYELDFALDKTARLRVALDEVAGEQSGLSAEQLRTLSADRVYHEYMIGQPLRLGAHRAASVAERAARALWGRFLHDGQRSVLSFAMLGRLAELILRENPKVLRALRATYHYVFLDEFQDTTGVQYALTCTAFRDSTTVLTAVGDHKQRIMAFAGALDGVFAAFKRTFRAEVCGLQMNYRSAPELVRIQRHLISAMDADAVLPNAANDGSDEDGECRLLLFRDHEHEAAELARLIAEYVKVEEIAPRDICILTRNRPADYTSELCKALAEYDLQARLENEYQDLLAEPLVGALIHLMALACRKREPKAWAAVSSLLRTLCGTNDEDGAARVVDARLASFRSELSTLLPPAVHAGDVHAVLESAVRFLDVGALRQHFPQYRQGTFLDDCLAKCAHYFALARDRSVNWSAAIDDFLGIHSIPIMTVHKSKGLEYHTVVFVGLEDSALFGWRTRPDEEKCGFFVAFSRAKKRVIFTYCKQRELRRGREAQSRRQIAELYNLLTGAGVSPEEFT